MRATENGECQCGNPQITAGVTRIKLDRGQVVKCELCLPELIDEPEDADPNAHHSARLKIIHQKWRSSNGAKSIYVVALDGPQPKLPDGTKNSFSLTGLPGDFQKGDIVNAYGRFSTHPKYGLQLEVASNAQPCINESQAGLVSFLSRFPNIGRHRAEELLRRLGGLDGVLKILKEDPIQLTCVSGITEERAAEIKASYDQLGGYRDFRIFASRIGITESVISAAIEAWGPEAQQVISEDPFQLLDLPRIGFKTADEIHVKLGRDLKHPSRLAAGVMLALQYGLEEGNTYATDEELFDESRGRVGEEIRRLSLTKDEVETGLSILEREHVKKRRGVSFSIPAKIVREDGRVYLVPVYQAEKSIAEELHRLMTAEIKPVEVPQGAWGSLRPAPEQEEALRFACESPVLIVTGTPGCIDGETELAFMTRGRSSGRLLSIKKAYYKFNHVSRPRSVGVKFWRGTTKTLAMATDGSIGYHEIQEIVYSGMKATFLVVSAKGRRLAATSEHKFKVPQGTPGADAEGYKKLLDIRPGDSIVVRREEVAQGGRNKDPRLHRRETHVPFHPRARTKIVRTSGKEYTFKYVRDYRLIIEAAMNSLPLQEYITKLQTSADGLVFLAKDSEIHHKNENPLDNRLENLEVTTKEDHARHHGFANRVHFGNQVTELDIISSIEPYGERETYDLVMADPNRNFVAGGFVVHNSGKSALTKTILDVLEAAGHRSLLCAPTGKAAKRMTELTGRPASTIHRLTARVESSSDAFVLPASVVIVDELSMCGCETLSRLLGCVKTGARVIMIGDVDQLSSVDCGRVLYDLIESGTVPVVRLTKIFRQQSDGDAKRIPEFAKAINSGEVPDLWAKGTDVTFLPFEDPELLREKIVLAVTEQLPQKLGVRPEDIQVISPQKGEIGKKNWSIGTKSLNLSLQDALNPKTGPNEVHIGDGYLCRAADRVIHKKNNYDLGVMNGEQGTVLKVETRPFNPEFGVVTSWRTKKAKSTGGKTVLEVPSTLIVVDFGQDRKIGYTKDEARELQLAYCLTVHSCQGSSAKVVVYPIHDVHAWMNNRALVYTAVTRAEKYVLLLGQASRFKKALKNTRGSERRTVLQERLATEFGSRLLDDDAIEAGYDRAIEQVEQRGEDVRQVLQEAGARARISQWKDRPFDLASLDCPECHVGLLPTGEACATCRGIGRRPEGE